MVSIIIPVYDKYEETLGYTVRAIDSVTKHVAKDSYELIVIDNDSPSHQDPAHQKRFVHAVNPNLTSRKLTILNQNVGFGRAVNMGAKMATGEYVCQVNSDCELVENSVDILVNAMEYYGLDVAMPEHYENCQHYNLNKSVEVMGKDWRFGAFWIMRRSAFEAVGGFDESFEMCYFEDTDLWRRLEAAGYKIAGYRGTWVKHKGGASSLPNRDELFERNRKRFEEKWPD